MTRATMQLNQAALGGLPSGIPGPAYDRAAVARSIVHIGVGGFYRAHQALYLDDLLHLPGHEQWGYCGVGLLAHDAAIRDAMLAQDCLYTVVERSAQGGFPVERVDGLLHQVLQHGCPFVVHACLRVFRSPLRLSRLHRMGGEGSRRASRAAAVC